MQTSLVLTALTMGLVGGPHCVVMCGAGCAGVAQASGRYRPAALVSFLLGRLIGYATLGALAAVSVQALGALTVYSAAFRPVWSLLHLAAVALGCWLVLYARQPVWLEVSARGLWSKVRLLNARWGQTAPLLVGVLWSLMPCGLLYSALMVAALTSHAEQGALTMALFGLGSSVSLWAGPWVLLKLRSLGDGAWGVRWVGVALVLTSASALWMGLAHGQAPWCVAP